MLKTYKEVRKELEKYDKKLKLGEDALSLKKEIIVLTKSDVVEDERAITKMIKSFEKINKNVFAIALFDDKIVKKFSDSLVKILKE